MFVSGSVFATLIVAILWASSYHVNLCAFWSVNGKRYDVSTGQGALVVVRLDKYRFQTPLRFGYTDVIPPTQKQIESFHRTPWWHGDNSRWERIGYTVITRTRFAGFESAAGTYWPPFVWQHPIVPFTLHQIPYWAFLVLTATPASICFIRSVRRQMKRESVNQDVPVSVE